MSTITINGVSIDPDETPVTLSMRGSAQDATATNYILVQTDGPLQQSDRTALEATGATILEYAPENTFICRYEPTNLAPVRALPFVLWADVYLEGFKIAPELRTAGANTILSRMESATVETSMAQEPRAVTVVLHRDVDPEAVRAKLAEAARINPEDIQIAGRKIELVARPQIVERLARIDAVHHLEEGVCNKLFNTVALGIIGADRTHGQARLRGAGQIVAVCDTGFDKGSTTNVHPAFAGRVLKVIPLGRTSGNDPDGHGTHVAGSVLGDGNSPTMGGPVTGGAPGAQLVLQSVLDAKNGLGGIPADLKVLFAQAHAEGARIHTNSWGAAVAGRYTSNSEEVDEYVWNNRGMTILFAAGNEGIDGNANGVIDNGSIGSPGTAKNCITVGASENLRPAISKKWGAPWPQDYPANPIRDDLWADNPNGLAAFSSRGPTRNQRIKPDVVAPGTAILSTHSRDANVGSFWGPSNDREYCFMGGTSMATPIVAGCAAVVREFLGGEPSAALIKAMLINGAVNIAGQYTPAEAGPIPNFEEGFGRVDMPNTVGPLPSDVSVEWFDEGPALQTGDEWTRDVALNQTGTLKVTLVWTDPPGEALQNDLDLILMGPSGEERHGNVAPGSSDFDRFNNVEQVEWTGLDAGTWTITVRAFRAALHPQNFALVVRTTILS
ncbi:S8 family serine peptidase [Sphingomonas solaris]|uniref:S8 family serine peptidase n=1 Tax=Alterirhizorhabdus solaris TaxID=2529389 RepID=A0A558QWB0_9SPHN|nr:S8 family serine peptidase [Sphingomonas solaris]TVV71405.1 S8 family serine peptidase [Sphingomonas solaris]